MNGSDSPDDRMVRLRLEALTLATQALSALLLPLEGANRELLGEVRAERQARQVASVAAAQPSALRAASAEAIRAIASDASARYWLGIGGGFLLVAIGILAISSVSAAPGTAAGAIIAVVDHHLPGGSRP